MCVKRSPHTVTFLSKIMVRACYFLTVSLFVILKGISVLNIFSLISLKIYLLFTRFGYKLEWLVNISTTNDSKQSVFPLNLNKYWIMVMKLKCECVYTCIYIYIFKYRLSQRKRTLIVHVLVYLTSSRRWMEIIIFIIFDVYKKQWSFGALTNLHVTDIE